jgi:DNA polymerase III delta prime subunit
MLISARNGHEAENAQQPVARPAAAQSRPVSRNESQINDTSIASLAPLQFRKAVKHDAKVRLAITGPSGSGKTYTLLKLATELGGPIAVVDTERGSAEKYADLFEFDTLPLDSFSPDLIPRLIEAAVVRGYRSLIIDSLSHFWCGTDGEFDQVEKVKRRLRDNGFAAWREVTPKHNRMIDAMLGAPIHILVSLRVKTEWVVETDERTGKAKPRKIGLQPVMRDGIEYEFDVCGDMDQENTLVITKSRCPKLASGVFPKPGKEFADVLKAWLGGVQREQAMPEPSSKAPVAPESPKKSGAVNGPQTVVTEELDAIWRRMCSPRGVVKELENLKAAIERLPGSTGVAEYYRILRQHGIDHPMRFKARQPARLCAKDLFGLLEELRRNARENASQLPLENIDFHREAPTNAVEGN